MPPVPLIPGRLRRALAGAGALGLVVLALVPAAIAAGPPFPDPVLDQAVYDEAGVLSTATVQRAETMIDAIENRTGAEIVVYTQLVPAGVTTGEAEAHAIALMDQWGVGRRGIDDGLVILFDLHRNDPCHGQVQLYAGPGFQATYLTNSERQAIFENDMLPLLRECDLDGALLVAMDRIDGATSPTHAATLQVARVADAILGLILAPLALFLFIGVGLMRWYREGRDPVYLDDASILMPAPPPGLTPAAGAAIRDGGVGRRSLTAASLDLAVRGYAGFRSETHGLLIHTKTLGILAGEAVARDPAEQMRMERARRRPMDGATAYLRGRLDSVAGIGGYIEPDRITELGQYVSQFDKHLETHLVTQGWYREGPSLTKGRWVGRAVLTLFAGIAGLVAGFNLPSGGLVALGGALVVAAIALLVISSAMPARTQAGAVIRAMLEAYRRTLQRTMDQARSMGQVAAEAAIPLIESPDDAVTWGVALGLQEEVERVLERSAEDMQAGGSGYYTPAWYLSGGTGSGGGGGGWAPGLMSSSPIPDFGGMMAALGTIGNSPASSGSGGGFSGGGSGGGGGGAGGGF